MPRQCIGNITLYYEETGSGAPLLLIHGLGSSTRDWQHQVAFFRERYRVITFDVCGHGRSEKPAGPYYIEHFARDAAGLLDALDVGAAHVAGVSMGGMIGLQLAADTPAKVCSLTVVNSMAEVPAHSLRRRLQFFGRKLFVRCFGMKAVGWILGRRLFPAPEQKALQHEFARRWAQNDRRAYIAAIDAIAGWSVAERLPEITCPTLFLTADQDYTPVAAKHAAAARMPDARVQVIPDSRHALPVERPAAFNAALGSFLAQQDVPAHS